MKELADGICILCVKPKRMYEIACYIDSRGADYLCVCDECFNELVTVENVMRFADSPGRLCHSDEERFKESVWSELYTYDEIMRLCRKDFDEWRKSPVAWEQMKIKSRLAHYIQRYYKDGFVESAVPDIYKKADELIKELEEEGKDNG